MSNIYQIYLISDSTGETLDRIFTAIKAQFKNIDYKMTVNDNVIDIVIVMSITMSMTNCTTHV